MKDPLPAPPARPPAMNDSLSILVIEDDEDTLANLCDVLGLDGHRVVGVTSIDEARRASAEGSFTITITDRKLPDGMIEDLLPELRQWLPDSEIIVVTGFADMQSTITAFRMGVTDYVIKPIIPEDLLRTVKRIANQHRLEAELAREHAFAELVLRTAEAIVLVLDLEGRVRQVNPYFEQLTGWQNERLIGRDWFRTCIPEEDEQRVREVFVQTAHEIDTRGVVNAVVGPEGRRYQIRWSNTTLHNHLGEVDAILAVGVDISDLSDAQARALQAGRLAAIGQTMTALAHESRNALQRIQAAAEMLELEIGDNSAARQDLRSIRRATDDLKSLLEEVRSYAAPIHLRRTRTSLPELWRRVWQELASFNPDRDAELVESGGACEVTAEIDVLRMEQVFRNLFENALAACADPVRIHLRCDRSGDRVRVIVCDNGPGMSGEHLAKLFEPFFTTKQSGTGLGLPICQRIVQAHGGSISARSTASGAEFEISLPPTKPSQIELSH